LKRFANSCSEAEQKRIVDMFAEVFPRIVPAGWLPWGAENDYYNCRWMLSTDGLKVAVEVEFIDDALWLHVSFSRRDRDPNYFDMQRVKDTFVGVDRKAVMVLPARHEHYNFAKHCLHFYSPLDRDPLPDFRAKDGGL
jgi:hypothetical protein